MSLTPSKFSRPFGAACIAILLTLAALVGWLQLHPGEDLLERSLKEQTRLVYIPACRGALLDRFGTPLNFTVPGYSIVIRPELIRDPRDTRNRTLEKLSAVIANLGLALGKDFYDFRPSREEILRHLKQAPAMPMTLWEDVDADVVARWAALRDEFPATELLLSWRRIYDSPQLAPHLRGRVRREAPRQDEDMRRFWNANSQVLRGISGMERVLENDLAGRGGSELLQTDVLSYRSRILNAEPPDNGDDIRLTISLPLQKLADELFSAKGYRGAAVAIDMASGEVLLMHSAPTPHNDAQKADDAPSQVNRALAGYYPAGSVMKPLLALYAQEYGIADASFTLDCPGYFSLGKTTRVGCSHIHGKIAMVDSIALSCNTYYCALAQKFTHEQFDAFADEFGFGQRTGAVLSGQESAGVPFTPAWVKQNRKSMRTWLPGDAANAGIGQGGWAVTPMQVALAMNYALTGRLLTPLYTCDAEIKIRKEHQWKSTAQRVVMDGMRGCVQYGTATCMKNNTVSIMAKTGTAEVGGKRRPHAWIVAAAPADTPRYLVVVIVENGGSGGKISGPIASQLLQALCKE